MFDLDIPPLRLKYRDDVEVDLLPLLYVGGAECNARKVQAELLAKKFGEPISIRLDLVKKIYDVLDGRLTAGSSIYSTKSNYSNIRRLYTWADNQNLHPTADNITKLFLDWTDALIHQQRVGNSASKSSVFNAASKVSSVLNEILNIETGLLNMSRLRKDRYLPKSSSTRSEKQNITSLTEIGHLLLDITKALDAPTIMGRLPVVINLRSGLALQEWNRLTPDHQLRPTSRNTVAKSRKLRDLNPSIESRRPLINLRLEAELLIFISQTGMNLGQAHLLTISKFSYQSDSEGYLVRRVYKNRRGGEVVFHIYSEYRVHFEAFLAWRSEFFDSDETLLFPIRSHFNRPSHLPPNFGAIKKRCANLEIAFIGPRELRKSRINWLIRQSTPEAIVASMHQHSEATLLQSYLRPNHQVAVVELSRFMSSIDKSQPTPGPGACNSATPIKIIAEDISSPEPDCVNPAGCLFCAHQRDIQSLDHVWSLMSFRYCKTLELCKTIPNKNQLHPAELTIRNIGERLDNLKSQLPQSEKWIEEAEMRIAEGEYHPAWDIYIRMLELSA
ncbi:TPA: hypothetical protein ACG5DM_003872 [Pseudomonas putida]